MNASLRFLLLGIALILFGRAFPGLVEPFLIPILASHASPRWVADLIEAIFPLAGLIVAFVGFFKRDAPSAA